VIPSQQTHGDLSNDGALESKGVYRDGKYVVVNLQDYEFPLRCVRTNEPVTEFTYYRVHLISKLAAYFGGLTTLIFYLFRNRREDHVDLRIGLLKRIVEQQRRHQRIGNCLILAGVIGLIIYAVYEFIAAANGVVRSVSIVNWLIPSCLVAILIAGVPFLLLAAPKVSCRRRNGNLLWVTGAHQEFLRGLPVWRFGQISRTALLPDAPNFSGLGGSE